MPPGKKNTGGGSSPKPTPSPGPKPSPKATTTRPSGTIAKAPTKSKGRGNPLTAAQSGQYSSYFAKQAAENRSRTRVVNNKDRNKNKKFEVGTGSASVSLPLDEPDDPIIPGDGGGDAGSTTTPSVKVPDRDALITLRNDNADQALITAVLFEQIAATELVKFVKNDTVDGINQVYKPISNLSQVRTKLDTSYLISKQRSDTTIDNGFSIRLTDKIPSIDYLFENNIPNYIYFDSTIGDNGSLIIELDNIDTDEIVEVEIDTSGTIEEVR